jgi:hypothetical protein
VTEHSSRALWRYYLIEIVDHWYYIAFGILIGAFSYWMLARPEATTDRAASAACEQMYRLATTPTDTARVDATYPLGSAGKDHMTCGGMRALGMLK